jgi:sensor histidine kinase YesM
MVPNLILQPIVENAIRHGVARQTSAGSITIRSFRKNGRLVMQVEDNGPGLSSDTNRSLSGIGLSNTRARLEKCYGENYELEVANAGDRGVVVTLEIPVIEAARSEG